MITQTNYGNQNQKSYVIKKSVYTNYNNWSL